MTISTNARRTGRTTRMLAEAERKSQEGWATFVLCHSREYAKTLQALHRESYPDTQVQFKSMRDYNLQNAARMVGKTFPLRAIEPGTHPDCVALIDHFAAEIYYDELSQQLEYWDKIRRNFDKDQEGKAQ